MMSFVAETLIFMYVGMDAIDIEKWKMSKMRYLFCLHFSLTLDMEKWKMSKMMLSLRISHADLLLVVVWGPL